MKNCIIPLLILGVIMASMVAQYDDVVQENLELKNQLIELQDRDAFTCSQEIMEARLESCARFLCKCVDKD